MPSLLETFFIMFESNADKVKRSNEGVKKSTDDVEEGLKRSDRAAAVMGENIIGAFKGVASAAVAAFSVAKVFGMVTAEAQLNAELAITAERLGWSVAELDAWNLATQIAGGTQGEFAQSLDFLNKNLASVDATGKSRLLPFLDEMGVKAVDAQGKVRPLPDLLRNLADRFKTMDIQKGAGFAERLGIGPGLLLLLRKGGEEVDRLVASVRDSAPEMQEAGEKALAWRTANLELDDSLGDMARKLGLGLLPAITAALKSVRGWVEYLDTHRGLVVGFFAGVGAAVVAFYLPPVIAAASATWLLLAPILGVVAVLAAVGAAFALVYDDVQHFMAGQDSLLGDILKKWPWIGETIHAVVSGIGSAFEWLKGIAVPIFEIIKDAARILWDAGLMIAVPIIERIKSAMRALAPIFQAAFEIIKTASQPILWVLKKIGDLVDWVSEKLGWVIKHLAEPFQWAAKQMDGLADAMDRAAAQPAFAGIRAGQSALATANTSPFSANPTPGWTLGGALGDRSKHQTVTLAAGAIVVNTQAADAQAVGDVVNTTFANQLRQANDHFDDGVRG